jgi:hypothetical protein
MLLYVKHTQDHSCWGLVPSSHREDKDIQSGLSKLQPAECLQPTLYVVLSLDYMESWNYRNIVKKRINTKLSTHK